MKPKLLLALVAGLLTPITTTNMWAGNDADPSVFPPLLGASSDRTQSSAQEDFGYDIFAGKTNKITRIHSTNVLWVYVIWEGNKGGRKIPREDLPRQLRARFPYDPEKAAEYRRQQAAAANQAGAVAGEQAARARVSAGDATNAKLVGGEQAVLAEIARLQNRDVELAREISTLRSLPKGQGRHARANQLAEEQQRVRDQIIPLKARVDAIQAQRNKLIRSDAAIQVEVEKLRKRDGDLQKEIDILTSLPKGHGRQGQALQLKAEQRNLRKRISELESQAIGSSARN